VIAIVLLTGYTLRTPRSADAQGPQADSDPIGSDLEDIHGDFGAV
jgi:hypothetical protein